MDVANKTAFAVTPEKLLSGKAITLLCIILAIAGKIILIQIAYNFNADLLRQGLAAKNMADGHGLTLEQVHASDLSKVVYDPMVGWPPAYSLSVIPFYWLFNKDIVFACLFAAWVYGVLFIPLVWALFKQLNFPQHIINLFILYYGFSVPEYTRGSFATDQPALMCYMLLFYLLLVFVKGHKKPFYGIWLGVASALGAWYRYMYLPVSFIVPALLIWSGYRQKDKRFLRGGVYAFVTNLLLIAALLAFEHYYTGSAAYVRPTTKGFFPFNLSYTYPFSLAPFADVHFYTVQFRSFTGWTYERCLVVVRSIGILFSLTMLYVFIRFALRNKEFSRNTLSTFFLAGGLLSTGCIAVLFYLSVTINGYYGFPDNAFWVYCSEERYYVVAIFCLQVWLLWWLFVRKPLQVSKRLKIYRVLFLLLIGIEVLHGGYMANKYAFQDGVWGQPITSRKEAGLFINNMMEMGKQQQADVVFASLDPTICGRATMAGAKGLYMLTELNTTPVHCEQKTLLVLLIKDFHLPWFADFLHKKDVKTLPGMEEFNVFYCYLSPGEN